jgi:hypothetical protein
MQTELAKSLKHELDVASPSKVVKQQQQQQQQQQQHAADLQELQQQLHLTQVTCDV